MDVSIIIVNYNTRDLTRNCLLSIFDKTQDINYEVIVSDNGSKDGSVEMIKSEFPQVVLIENNVNLGFGAANNRGLALAKGKYIFYLNSDTLLLNNAVKLFFDYWEKSSQKNEIGALGCNLLDGNYRLAHSFGCFPTEDIVKKLWKKRICHSLIKFFIEKIGIKLYKEKSYQDKYIGEVDFITGADLFVKNDVNAFFNEDIFLYCEDLELQKRMSDNNLKRLIIDGPGIVHFQGMSGNKKVTFESLYFSFGKIQNDISLLKYFSLHGNPEKARDLTEILKKYWSIPFYKKYTKNYLAYL